MLCERKKLSTDVQSILDTQTETWGIKVSNVEIRTVELTENMVPRHCETSRGGTRPPRQDNPAEAEFQASQTLVNAAQILIDHPRRHAVALFARRLTEIGAEQNSTDRVSDADRHYEAIPRDSR